MIWLIFLIVLGIIVFMRIRAEQRAGRWSWSKFFFSLGFGALECVIITAPLLMNMNSRFFWPAYGAAWVVAIALFVKFILIARKWKFPDTRTSTQAAPNDRNNQQPPR
jgi:hypothetical protein